MPDNKIKLTIATLKVPITRLSDNEDSKEKETIIQGIDFASYEVTNQEELEMKSWIDLPNQSKLIKAFNERQIKFAEEDSTRDYILKKIIKK